MKRRIIKYTFIISSLLLLFSCTNPLLDDPRIYNKNTEEDNSTNPQNPDINLNEDGSLTPFDNKNEWYNNPSCNGDETSKEKCDFPSSDFDTLALTSWFNTSNVPQYEIKKDDVWEKITTSTSNDWYYNGPNTKSMASDKNSGFNVENVIYYKYKGYNPLYTQDTNQKLSRTMNNAPRLERFDFYRFTGTCMGNNLDNYLISIDTYSKFIYAFAKPTAFKEVVGNQVPTKWGIVDEGKLFYEYDPVGYVQKNADGTYSITIYKWFQDNLANNNYTPVINEEYKSIAKKTPEGAGSSPFFVPFTEAKTFSDNVKGKTFSYRDNNGKGKILYSLEFNFDGTIISLTKNEYGKDKEIISDGTLTESNSLLKALFTSTDGTKYNLILSEDLQILSLNNISYTYNYHKDKDLGPSFINRIEHNKIYKPLIGKKTYKFNQDNSVFYENTGKNPISVTYTYIKEKDRDLSSAQAIYKDSNKYYGIKLSSNGTKMSITNEALTIEEIDWSTWPVTVTKQN